MNSLIFFAHLNFLEFTYIFKKIIIEQKIQVQYRKTVSSIIRKFLSVICEIRNVSFIFFILKFLLLKKIEKIHIDFGIQRIHLKRKKRWIT